MRLWLRADAGAKARGVRRPVVSWEDQAAGRFHASQPDATSQPLLKETDDGEDDHVAP